MRIQSKIQKWGNSLALRLTGPVRTIPQFEVDMVVNIDIKEDGISIHPVKTTTKKLPFSEKDLLKGLDAKTAHADALTTLTPREFGD